MKLPSNDYNLDQHHSENYPTRSNGIIPTWLKGESKEASKYQRGWVDGMSADEWQKHLKREKEYQQSLGNNKYY